MADLDPSCVFGLPSVLLVFPFAIPHPVSLAH